MLVSSMYIPGYEILHKCSSLCNCDSKNYLTYFILVSLIKVFSTKIQYRKYISSHPFLVFKEGLQGVKNSMRGIVKVRVVFK